MVGDDQQTASDLTSGNENKDVSGRFYGNDKLRACEIVIGSENGCASEL